MRIGDEIRRERISRGLSQKALGDMCIPKIDASHIRKIESGRTSPTMATVNRINEALKKGKDKTMGTMADAFFEAVKGGAEDNLIKDLDEYLDEKDHQMMHMNPLQKARELGRENTDYFFGFRHGACEVIGEITAIINGYKYKKGTE